MKSYARIEAGRVMEIIDPATYGIDIYATDGSVDQDGNPVILHHANDEVPIQDRFAPGFVATLVDITGLDPQPQQTWTYDGSVFAPYVAPPPTPAQILSANTSIRNQLLDMANRVIPALQDAVDLDDPSANPALLLQWKQFRVNVNKVVLTNANPNWPTPPQAGYGDSAKNAVSNA